MNNVTAVVSAYNPAASLLNTLRSLIGQVGRVIVVDDGSTENQTLTELELDERFELFSLKSNSGIASALNVGIKEALKGKAEFILTIDQDSVLESGYVEAGVRCFAQSAKTTRLGIVISDSINNVPSTPPKYSPEGLGLVTEGIQSGMLISAACLSDVGLFEEALVIDCVDIEFCLRARDHQWQIAVSPGSNITHSLGEQVPIRRWGKHSKRAAANTFEYHAPFRQYYITRNNIDLCFRNLRKRPRWVLSVIKRELRPTFLAVCAGPHRAKQALAVLMGTLHGLIRRRGKIPFALNARLQS